MDTKGQQLRLTRISGNGDRNTEGIRGHDLSGQSDCSCCHVIGKHLRCWLMLTVSHTNKINVITFIYIECFKHPMSGIPRNKFWKH